MSGEPDYEHLKELVAGAPADVCDLPVGWFVSTWPPTKGESCGALATVIYIYESGYGTFEATTCAAHTVYSVGGGITGHTGVAGVWDGTSWDGGWDEWCRQFDEQVEAWGVPLRPAEERATIRAELLDQTPTSDLDLSRMRDYYRRFFPTYHTACSLTPGMTPRGLTAALGSQSLESLLPAPPGRRSASTVEQPPPQGRQPARRWWRRR